MVTRDGYAKILDFGLAKLVERPVSPDDATLAGIAPHSTPGLVIGTAASMSPEQAQGRAADARGRLLARAKAYAIDRGYSPWRFFAEHDRLLDSLRGDPRFDALLERAHAAWKLWN